MSDDSTKSRLQQRSLKCGICNRVYSNKKVLFRHLHKHEHPTIFSCSECSKTFPTKTRLNIHSRIHSGERPFKCSYCQIYFASRFQLKLHQRLHTGEKPYSCSYCEKEFSSSSGLRQHVKTHTKESPFSCNMCSKSFKQKEKLKQHERIHTGVRPFMCDQCPKTFRIKNALVRHLRIHSGDTFKCGLCPKEFGELYALKKHHRSKHTMLPFTGPSQRSSSEDHTKTSSTRRVSNESPLKKRVIKVRRSKNSRNKVQVTTQKQRRRQIRKTESRRVSKKCMSGSDLSKDVVEKLYLAIGQRDTSSLVEENGWHRIPLPVMSHLPNQVMEAVKKSTDGDLKVSGNLNNGIQLEEYLVPMDSECLIDQRNTCTIKPKQVTEQHVNFTSTRQGEIITVEPCQMVSDIPSSQKQDNIGGSSSCQQTDQVRDAGRRRRQITHPSTIEYFPAEDQTLESTYGQEREEFQFFKNPARESASTTYTQKQPYTSLDSDLVALGSDLEEPYFDTGSFKDSSVFSEQFYSKPDYHQHHFQQPNHEMELLRQQTLDHQRYYQRHLPHQAETKQHRHTATLHHHPEPYQEDCLQDQPLYFNIQGEYNHMSGVQEAIGQECTWHPLGAHEPATICDNLCLTQPHVLPLYQQASSDNLNLPHGQEAASCEIHLSQHCQQVDSSSNLHVPQPCQQASTAVLHMPHPCQQGQSGELCLPHPCEQAITKDLHVPHLCQKSPSSEFSVSLPCKQPASMDLLIPHLCQQGLSEDTYLPHLCEQASSRVLYVPDLCQQGLSEEIDLRHPCQQSTSRDLQVPYLCQQGPSGKFGVSHPCQQSTSRELHGPHPYQQGTSKEFSVSHPCQQSTSREFSVSHPCQQPTSRELHEPHPYQQNSSEEFSISHPCQQSTSMGLHESHPCQQGSSGEFSVSDPCQQPFSKELLALQSSFTVPHLSAAPQQHPLPLRLPTVSSMLSFPQSLEVKSNHPLSCYHGSEKLVQQSIHQKEPLISNQQHLHRNESIQSNELLLQQHSTAQHNQPLINQHEHLKSNQQQPLFCNFSSSTRLAIGSNISNHRRVISSDISHTHLRSVSTFSRLESSVIHHKPAPVVSHDYDLDDTWPVFSQIEHINLDLHQDSTQSFSHDITRTPVLTSTCNVNLDDYSTNQPPKHIHTETKNSLDLSSGTCFPSVPGSIALGNAYLNADRLQASSETNDFSAINHFSTPKQSNSTHAPHLHCSYLQTSSLPASNLITSSLPTSNVQTPNLSTSNLLNLNLPTSNVPIFSLQTSSPPISNSQTLNLQTSNLQIQNLETPNLPYSGCFKKQPLKAAKCFNVDKPRELSTISASPDQCGQISDQFEGVTVHDHDFKLPNVEKLQSSHKSITGSGFMMEPSHKFVTKLDSGSGICQNTVDDQKELIGYSNMNVSEDEMDNVDQNDLRQTLMQQANTNGCIIMREAVAINGESKSRSKVRGRPRKTRRFFIYRKVSLSSSTREDTNRNGRSFRSGTSNSLMGNKMSGSLKSPSVIKNCSKLPSVMESSSKLSSVTNYSKLPPVMDSSKLLSVTNYSKLPPVMDSSKLPLVMDFSQLSSVTNYSKLSSVTESSSKLPPVMDSSKLLSEINFSKLPSVMDSSKLPSVTNFSKLRSVMEDFSKLPLVVDDSLKLPPVIKDTSVLPSIDSKLLSVSSKHRIFVSEISKNKQVMMNQIPEKNITDLYNDINEAFAHESSTFNDVFDCEDETIRNERRKHSHRKSEKTADIDDDDFDLLKIDRKIIYRPKRRSTSPPSSGDSRKVEFIQNNCVVNSDNNIRECRSCGKKYKQANLLKSHMFTRHFEELQHECPTCKKEFPQNSRLERHMKTHIDQKPYPCSICPQTFTAKKYLDNHIKRHEKQPPIFACGDCGKTFPRRYQLKIHYRTHTGEKPYKCSHCASYFATCFQVRLHERVHSDVLPYQCRYCSKCFRSNTNLALHTKRHTNDRPYLCATCGATFYEASKLKAHIRVHTGVHPFMCDQCPKTFKVKHLLVRHLRWHNGDTFKCEHCEKPFDEKWVLKAHIQKHHSGM